MVGPRGWFDECFVSLGLFWVPPQPIVSTHHENIFLEADSFWGRRARMVGTKPFLRMSFHVSPPPDHRNLGANSSRRFFDASELTTMVAFDDGIMSSCISVSAPPHHP